ARASSSTGLRIVSTDSRSSVLSAGSSRFSAAVSGTRLTVTRIFNAASRDGRWPDRVRGADHDAATGRPCARAVHTLRPRPWPADALGCGPMSRTLPPPALPNAPGELRQDPLSGGGVAITAGRAARPEAFLGDVGAPRGPLGCPFCPGNEHMTPPEVWADREAGTDPDKPGWLVRVVPNKFPAFAGPITPVTGNGGLYRSEPTAGAHEVV